MIPRIITTELELSAAEYPVVTILGPRQSGKTTLARMTFPEKPYLSLEDPDIRLAAEMDPRGFLGQIANGGILDEVQRLPDLLSYLQRIIDESRQHGRFILTGSHQPRLHEAISQSLAGRTAILTLWPFSLRELKTYKPSLSPYALIVRGFFPRVYEEELDHRRYYSNYLMTYVERDIRALIQLRDLSQFQKFLVLLAGRIGQVINYTSLANDIGVSGATIKSWLSVLKATFIIIELAPFSANIGKRLIKSPKIYFTDVGLAAFLLGIHTEEQAARDPLRGQLYENLVIVDIVKGALNKGIRPDIYFYRDSHGNEVDLLIHNGGHIIPVEIKSAATFSSHFLKGVERFRDIAKAPVPTGAILYNGEQQLTIKGIRIFNPLHAEDIWTSLAEGAKDFSS